MKATYLLTGASLLLLAAAPAFADTVPGQVTSPPQAQTQTSGAASLSDSRSQPSLSGQASTADKARTDNGHDDGGAMASTTTPTGSNTTADNGHNDGGGAQSFNDRLAQRDQGSQQVQ